MRWFVTGGTGFIGGHLIERLVAEGHEVWALVRTPSKAGRLRELGVNLVSGDLTVFSDPQFALPEVDFVAHIAGVVASPSPEQFEAINYSAVVALRDWLEAQPWSPRRVLFASSMSAAGPSVEGRPWTEADPVAPTDPYGDAKARAEVALREASFPVTSFRPPPVFGPGDAAWLTLFQLASWGIGVRLPGTPRFSWVYVDDLVDAILAMADDDRDGSFVYYTTSEDDVDHLLLWEALRKALDRRILVVPVPAWVLKLASRIGTVGAKAFGFRNQLDDKQVTQILAPAYLCTSAALTRDLGWKSTLTFDEAVRRTAEGYRKAGWL